ncbi:MAG: PKD domain-containing protein, partial [Myxococcales bacterium]
MARTLRFAVTLALVAPLACSQGVKSPTAAAAQPGTFATGNVIRLDGSGSTDPQGRPLFFEWSFTSLPAGSAATLSDSDKMLPSFVADMPGDYTIQLVVSNGVVTSAPVTVTVHVSACGFSPPAVTASPATFTVTPRTLVHLSVTATDADNQCLPASAQQTLTLGWQVVSRPPESGAIVSDPSSATPTFTPDVPGSYQLRVVATDSTGR